MLQLGPIADQPMWKYTSKLETIDFNLTINYENDFPPFIPSDGHIPKNETFTFTSGRINRKRYSPGYLSLSYNRTFNEIPLILKYPDEDFLFDGSKTDNYLNVSNFIDLNDFSDVIITGNTTYIATNQNLPDDQEGLVFLIEEENGCEEQLDNMTNASAAILIHNNTQGGSDYYTDYNFSNITIQCARVNKTSDNLTAIIEKLENNTIIIMDNSEDNQTITFFHDLSNMLSWWPNEDFFILFGDKYIENLYPKSRTIWVVNPIFQEGDRGFCYGFILYDNNEDLDDVYIMDSTIRHWMGRAYGPLARLYFDTVNQPCVQVFSVNKSVGNFLKENISYCTISGYFEQNFIEENHTPPGNPELWTSGVKAYNVESNITIDESPDDAIIILSNRFDSWYNECPGDSGAGTGVLMGIAKYIQEKNIKPKYNLTFLFTTGEEYGMRGAWHYSHSHPESQFNIIRWIGTDQLSYMQPEQTGGTPSLILRCNNLLNGDIPITMNIAEKSDYTTITGYGLESEWVYEYLLQPKQWPGIASTDDVAWADRTFCKTVCVSKGWPWWRHHLVGLNHTEGDSMKYMDRRDFNTTFNVVWNITKYYCFDSDCWFKDITFTPYDSSIDSDSNNDSVNVTFTANTSFPHERIMVKAVLISRDHPVLCRFSEKENYIVTPASGVNDTLSVELLNRSPEGNYKLRVYLFNSTGEVDNDVFNPLGFEYKNMKYANITFETDEFYLHPPNSPPDTPSDPPSGSTSVKAGVPTWYTISTTDPEEDWIWYQWRWNLSEEGNYYYTRWIMGGPHESGEDCTKLIEWMHPGTYQVQVRAKDVLLNPNVMSGWSPPLTVTVSECEGWSSWNSELLDTFTSSDLLPSEETSCNGFVQGVFIESQTRGSLNWTWDFGDDSPVSYGENVVHNYSNVGNYTVNLTIKNGEGYTYNTTTNISVLILKANFNTSSVLQPNVTIYFNDTSDGYYNITNWTWDFGDGNTSYQQNTNHTYPTTGAYNVSLIVLDEENNSHTCYKTIYVESVLSDFVSVECSPDVVGFGSDVNIVADFFDNQSMINNVIVNVVYPDNSSENFTMDVNYSIPYDYMLVFNDTWQIGEYNYSVYVVDNAGNMNCTSGFNFTVSAQANISVCTKQDDYGNDEIIEITDPPSEKPLDTIGYELLDNDSVLRLWNRFDSYYFNTSNGLQITNHFNEYWSRNVLMLGYYNNDQWNLVYRVDELSGFNKNIESDNETFVNITLWKDLSYGGYNFRLAIRYYLGVDDNVLTVIPYIKNLGVQIPFVLGFAWEIKDIQVDMTPGGDFIEINGTSYLLNNSLDETYMDLSEPCFDIKEDVSENDSESLYLGWDGNLDYRIWVKSRSGQYNAPVTLGIKIGTLNVNQEKYTSLFWHDASEVYYHFDAYDTEEYWDDPESMIDSDLETFSLTEYNGTVEFCNGNSCEDEGLGVISKVELRVNGYHLGKDPGSIIIRPVFDGGKTDGENYTFDTPEGTPCWSDWFDITNDGGRGGGQFSSWSWSEVQSLLCDVVAFIEQEGDCVLYCSMVEIRVTFNNQPMVSDPVPVSDSMDVALYPSLNISVLDPDGDYMDVTWYSNSTPSYLTLRPNANGSSIQLSRYPTGYAANYMCVDETVVNDSDYVHWKGDSWIKDTYNLPNHGSESGVINSVVVYARCARVGSVNMSVTNSSAKLVVKSGGVYYYGDEFLPPYSSGSPPPLPYTNYSFVWTCNPVDGDAWSWNDIDNLQAGVAFIGNQGDSRCTQLYVVVNYTNPSNWIVFGTNNSVGNGIYHQQFDYACANGNWWYWKVSVDDGTVNVSSSVFKFYTGFESKIVNTGSTNISGYLLMQILFNDSGEWVLENEVVNESEVRIIAVGGESGLDEAFNGVGVNTDSLSHGSGTYRVYAAFRDPDGNVLVCDDDSLLEAWYEFTIDI